MLDTSYYKVVTSTSVYIGAHGNLLEDKPENCKETELTRNYGRLYGRERLLLEAFRR